MLQRLSIQNHLVKYSLSLAVMLLPAIAASGAGAKVRTNVIAVSGDVVPNGNGTFYRFGFGLSGSLAGFNKPALNNSGEASFVGILTGVSSNSANTGLFRGDGTRQLVQIARGGDPAPDGNGVFAGFNNLTPSIYAYALNDAGQAAFRGTLNSTNAGGNDNRGVFRGDGTGSLVQIARSGATAPDGNGTFSSFGIPALNDTGQAAFRSLLAGTLGNTHDDRGVFRNDGMGSIVQIARKGQTAPDGNGRFAGFHKPALNNAGQTAFRSVLLDTAGGGSGDNIGIFRGDPGATALVQIARAGDLAPDDNGTFAYFSDPALNDAGQSAFSGRLSGTSGGSSDSVGIFRGDGVSSLVQISRAGEAAPDGNGSFSSFLEPALNEAGQTAYGAFLAGTSGGNSDDRGIFRSDGASNPVQIAREGQVAPDGKSNFSSFDRPALNEAGQVAFLGSFTGASVDGSDDFGLYFYDDLLGLTQVSRLGSAFLGSTITNLDFENSSADLGDERSGFNDRGQIAYQFELADGRQGIAIATIVPEPCGLLLGVLACGVGLRRRRG